jgi:uncharacterized membrane protein
MQLTLAQGYGVATMAAVAAVALLLAWVGYRRAFGSLKSGQRITLFSLRAAAILIVVLLLFRPVLSYTKSLAERSGVVFMLDASASMSIADDASGSTRFNLARDKAIAWRELLKDRFQVRILPFADFVQTLDKPESLAAVAPTGRATSLAKALDAGAKQFPAAETAAVFLLSDGIHNASGDPLESAKKMGVPLNTVGVGARLQGNSSFRDVMVTGIDCPDRFMLNNAAKITASIDAVNLAGRVVKVFLDEDDKKIAEAELTLDAVEGSQQVTLDFRPTVKGRHTYTVRVDPVPGEKIIENNRRSAAALIVEAGLRVLYIEGSLRAEYGALADRFLAKDPNLEFCALVQTRPNVFLQRSNMRDLKLSSIPNDQATIDRFDVFLLGDIDASYIRKEQQEMLLHRVREGAGLMMLGGYHSLGPGGYAGTPLGDALPVALGNAKIGQYTEAFLPVLTPDGTRHPIFANIAGFFPTRLGDPSIAGLPTLSGCTNVGKLKPGATALAAVSASDDAMPVLAVQPFGRGRTAVFSADTTRRWQQGPRALNQDSPFLRFWGQTVRWLAGRNEAVDAKAGVSVTIDRTTFQPGETINLAAVVRNREGQGAADAKVAAAVVWPDQHKSRVPLAAVAGPSGNYEGCFQPDAAGQYAIIVEADIGGERLASDKIVIEVGRPNLEYEKLDLDERTLSALARAAGGRYATLAAADRLIENLDRMERKKIVPVEYSLYWPPVCWPLFVGIITAEWVLRRRFQLR